MTTIENGKVTFPWGETFEVGEDASRENVDALGYTLARLRLDAREGRVDAGRSVYMCDECLTFQNGEEHVCLSARSVQAYADLLPDAVWWTPEDGPPADGLTVDMNWWVPAAAEALGVPSIQGNSGAQAIIVGMLDAYNYVKPLEELPGRHAVSPWILGYV